MKKAVFIGLFYALGNQVQAQLQSLPAIDKRVDLAGTIGQSQGTLALSYVHNWRIGKMKRWEAGLGLRYTNYFGTKREFTTAPGRLSRSTTTPFVIVFAKQQTENWDTLTVQRPFVGSLNLSFNAGYNFSTKWSAGFNIDLIGFSFGRTSSAILTSNGFSKTEPAAKPTSFNVLLTGDNDYGSLNSVFFLQYKIAPKWGVSACYQFYFAEYKTGSVQQIAPDGTLVNRFRNKVNAGGAAISYHF